MDFAAPNAPDYIAEEVGPFLEGLDRDPIATIRSLINAVS
jgi:hypothetical protein